MRNLTVATGLVVFAGAGLSFPYFFVKTGTPYFRRPLPPFTDSRDHAATGAAAISNHRCCPLLLLSSSPTYTPNPRASSCLSRFGCSCHPLSHLTQLPPPHPSLIVCLHHSHSTARRKFDMGTPNSLWLLTKKSLAGALIGLTVSDRFFTIYSITGTSMYPTFTTSNPGFPGYLKGDLVLVERFCLDKYKFSCGDVIAFKSPSDHNRQFVKRLVALPGDWMHVPNSSDILKIPEGHCWVEGDNTGCSFDSRHFGPIPLGLVRGRVTHIIWPPQRASKIERKVAVDRIYSI
ncbi:hypothetical protein Cni_G07473 [Canna indica]|uniref:Mitochondrial inner membrane protease subunit 2 n=1 Tax=Canna indica TaxID=4628 RepID=A0AAQ3JYS2_9LILI|nr:hypothetical protein Cni_G07473 [Canna indica]